MVIQKRKYTLKFDFSFCYIFCVFKTYRVLVADQVGVVE